MDPGWLSQFTFVFRTVNFFKFCISIVIVPIWFLFQISVFVMEDVVSNRNIFGRFVNVAEDEEIFVSVKSEILTIVHRTINQLPQKVQVIKCDLADLTSEIKTSYIVERSSILEEDVYKKITLRGGHGENRIEVMEFKLCSDNRKEVKRFLYRGLDSFVLKHYC